MFRWLIAALGLWALYQVRMQFPPFFAAAVLAYLLSGPVAKLSIWTGLDRKFSVLIIYTLAIGAVGLALYQLAPMVAEQAVSLISNRQTIIENMVTQVAAATGWQLDVTQVTADLLDKVQTFISEKPSELLIVGNVLTHSLFFLVICLVSSIYMVLDSELIGAYILRFVPEEQRQRVSHVASVLNVKFSKYLVGQLFLVGIMSVLAYIILSLNHVRYALILALITGVLEIIPMIGPLLALALAAAVVTSQSGLAAAGAVAGLLWAARLFEDYVVVPRVVGHAVQIHPMVTIFAVLAGDTLGGTLGMLLAVPAAAAVKVILDNLNPPLPGEEEPVEETSPPSLPRVKERLHAWKAALLKWLQGLYQKLRKVAH